MKPSHRLALPSFAALALALALAAALPACAREDRPFSVDAPERARPTTIAELRGADAPKGGPPGDPAGTNAWSIGEGQRLYAWFNCASCHGLGGGGNIGPPLMDGKWLYGSDPTAVFASIVEGRPEGMPAFGGKLTTTQVWQLVAYVRSLSGLLAIDVAPGRSDTLSTRTPPSMTPTQRPAPQTEDELR